MQNVNKMMKQVQKMQSDMAAAQSALAEETVEVALDERLIKLAIKFLPKEPTYDKVREVLAGLRGVYVRVFKFSKPGEYAVVLSGAELRGVWSSFGPCGVTGGARDTSHDVQQFSCFLFHLVLLVSSSIQVSYALVFCRDGFSTSPSTTELP